MSNLNFTIVEQPISVAIDAVTIDIDVTRQQVVFQQPTQNLQFLIDEPVLQFDITGGILTNQINNNYLEEEVVYSKRVDFISDLLLYRGEGSPGILTSAPTWRVRRITIAVDGDVTEEWADGNADFDKIWDDHLSLSYS